MFPIVFNADENYIKYTSTLITSIIKNTNSQKSFKELCKDLAQDKKSQAKMSAEKLHFIDYESLNENEQKEGYVFVILSDFVSTQTRDKLAELQRELSLIYPCSIEVKIVDEKEFEGFPKSGAAHSNFLPYYRLIAPQFLQEYSKCLYLDSDMLCLCDIRELFTLDLGDKILACVGDYGSKKRKIKFKENGKEKIFYYDEHYFNSGFLLINTYEYKAVAKQCENLAKQATYIKAADQDLLNAIVNREQRLKLSFAYNFVTHAFCYCICKDEDKTRLNYTRAEFLESAKNPKILHFGYKPWKLLESFSDFKGVNVCSYWWDMASQTPIFKQELLEIQKSIAESSKNTIALGFNALEAFKTCNLFKMHSLLKNEDIKYTNANEARESGISGLCILLAEVIEFARRRHKGLLNVFFKIAKILRHYKKYANKILK
ncbi:glycosyltransferase family 8 protein [Campylobacter cuniculorum]|uniref:glycosyltransferase family 8 protein n=1 Tax=Campylobacter cuniculorum TaxID=374106 RepID=UPI0023F51268|nr:glycosyltransferase family 8 protein [Campylobacter cuniculorum]